MEKVREDRASSNPMRRQSHNINFFHACIRSNDDDHPNQCYQLHRCPAAPEHRHHPPSATPCANHGNEPHLPHSYHLSGHFRLPITCYLNHHHLRIQYQRWGLGPSLSPLRSQIHLIHRPGRPLSNQRKRNPPRCQHILCTHQYFPQSSHEPGCQYQQQSPRRHSTSRSILSSLSPHMYITHRPGRSLANPSHKDQRTSARSTNIYPLHQLNSLACTRTFPHRMGLFGYMHLHKNLP
ncbi:unnamed protein product [Schistocephalus solidus]|uniref:Uncharacterized protein n=1 Tax=Schistocephalus solidus TaxID=70667 RepID=A0A183TA45_SCHSO|nr:unnamed protein product [Schistocephalus solidus]